MAPLQDHDNPFSHFCAKIKKNFRSARVRARGSTLQDPTHSRIEHRKGPTWTPFRDDTPIYRNTPYSTAMGMFCNENRREQFANCLKFKQGNYRYWMQTQVSPKRAALVWSMQVPPWVFGTDKEGGTLRGDASLRAQLHAVVAPSLGGKETEAVQGCPATFLQKQTAQKLGSLELFRLNL